MEMIGMASILEMYPEKEIKFDISKIKLLTIDIEFPSNMDFQIRNLLQKRC